MKTLKIARVAAAAMTALLWPLMAFASSISPSVDSESNGETSAPSTAPSVPATAPDRTTNPWAPVTPSDDLTGGAYTTPTLLFIPAAALPTWNVRAITSLDVQGPTSADRLAIGTTKFGFAPGVGGELGLPFGITLGAGTNWVGGDVSPTPISGGLSPYFQVRVHILGDSRGRGFQLGTSATYKFVGFDGDPGELEWAVSSQYRLRYFEIGVQGTLGKDFATTDADGEVHAYAVVRPIPQLGLGGASQLRITIVSQPDETSYDVISGALASLTLGRWQVAALAGETTVGLDQGQVGGFGEIFGTARF